EIQADAFRMADVQVAVGLGRKAHAHAGRVGVSGGLHGGGAGVAGPQFAVVAAFFEIVLDDGAQEIGYWCGRGCHCVCGYGQGKCRAKTAFCHVCAALPCRRVYKWSSPTKLAVIMTESTMWLSQLQWFSSL